MEFSMLPPNEPGGDLADRLTLPLTWRGAIGQAIKAAMAPPEAVRLGDRRYSVGDSPPFVINAVEDDVLKALIITCGGAATLTELRHHSDCQAPHKVLRQIRGNYRQLAGYIMLPEGGRKGRGGYRCTIVAT